MSISEPIHAHKNIMSMTYIGTIHIHAQASVTHTRSYRTFNIRFNHSLIMSMYIKINECKLLNLFFQRNLYRKHDFKAKLRSLIFVEYHDFRQIFNAILSYYFCLHQLWMHNLRYYPFRYLKFDNKSGELYNNPGFIGGGSNKFSFTELEPYVIYINSCNKSTQYKFKKIVSTSSNALDYDSFDLVCNIPFQNIAIRLTVTQLHQIATFLGINVNTKTRSVELQDRIMNCINENIIQFAYTFDAIDTDQFKAKALKKAKKHQEKKGAAYKSANLKSVKKYQSALGEKFLIDLSIIKKKCYDKKIKIKHNETVSNMNCHEQTSKCDFPPPPPSLNLQYDIIKKACKDMSLSCVTELGCAICGKLTPILQLVSLSHSKLDLSILSCSHITQQERFNINDPIKNIDGPILLKELDNICKTCHKSLSMKKIPKMALANGKWMGKVPNELSNLTFTEQLLIARIRHNRCIVRVSSGMHKMRANAISFANPIPKVYDILPPPIEELDEVLAFIYTGPCKPTKSDFERTPLLVRRNKVKLALNWLKLNHCDYYDIDISQKNLNQYPESDIPVVVDYRQFFTNKNPESTAVNEEEEEEGTESGKCPFVVHGLTGEEYSTKSTKALKAIALKHLTSNGKILAIGHEAQPQSIYNNPQLFPQMMPWLFPYGLGGIGNSLQKGHVSDIAHKRHLLMYFDKRFQKDPYFPLIAFNHEQIKEATTAGYLLAEKSKFDDISKRLLDVDKNTLNDIIKRMEDGERILPASDEEKQCFQLLKDLDHVGGQVNGSITSKKYMRNEIWSLISFIGAPSWFITFAPADTKHPISLYFADTKETFDPCIIREHDERYKLIAQNPVAGARFFHFMSQMFIKHVLGVGENHPGLYGETNAYYGTVEQQGRLTLHMHMLLWIKGCLSPQEIRNRIMDPNSDFQKRIVEYLESVHIGEFLTGTMSDVKTKVEENSLSNDYTDPTQTLPDAPPPLCKTYNNNCNECKSLTSWWDRFKNTVDDLILHSNVHNCGRNLSNGEKTPRKDRPSCINQHGKCKARFPREIFEQTEVDPKTGALNVKKGEAWINTLTPAVTYLLRCNSDVTSLLSGTAIKAIVAYISDYVTKPGLKTYSIFDAIRSVFDRNSQMLGGSMTRKEKARRLIIQIVNSLTAKMEIGGPMASLYLLGNPDHYTSHKFVTVYWKNYVREVMNVWKLDYNEENNSEIPEKILLQKKNNMYVGVSSVCDYIYRPKNFENTTLYEWIQMAKRVKIKPIPTYHVVSDGEDELDIIEREVSTSHLNIKLNTKYNIDDNGIVDELNIVDNEFDDFIIDDTDGEYKEMGYGSDPEQDLKFLKDHPLYDTHVVEYDIKKKDVVPNFVGGSLPRRDRGDREYYCITMLTLFKPWRNGKDLKSDNYSWDETFLNHNFTPRQLQLMDNFNIRYECNDARDDYSAQLKNGSCPDGIFPNWLSSEVVEDIESANEEYQGDDFGDGDGDDNEEYGINKYSSLGPHGKLIQAQMDAAENSVRNAGWLDDSPDGLGPIVTTPLEPSITQPGCKWKAIIQEKRQEIVNERSTHIPNNNKVHKHTHSDPNENNVTLVDRSYLCSDFKAHSESVQNDINHNVNLFSLNTEQERAFRIVANHAVTPQSEQLKMYLGGMGGTGKSQVIRALKTFFENRNESHRFIVLGPTGTSAALLGGSTYHSFLGINFNSGSKNESAIITQVRSRLEGVDYIFIDEVSMLACHEMYKISSQLAKCLNVLDLPFGGVNIIFAGDFAQLPPVGGASLYSGAVGTQIHSGVKPHLQEAAIGKALWHQITTVVILRENMRQKSQTANDIAFRNALVNMRYGVCDPDDIQFLRSRVAGLRPEQPKVASKDFRNVAIICGVHSQKDIINQLGCERFAAETNQKLTNFYSQDRWGKESDPAEKKKWGKSKSAPKTKHRSNEIDYDDQAEIWKVRHGGTEHFAGKLSLCLGMPVMIRNNDATELCITKGQEGFVVGWQSTKGPHGKRILDTLFVKLDNPPQVVKIPGLPDNVVPIVKSTKTVTCMFPSDLKESIERQQAWVLPNFAMTAHASQGKTRPFNVVHLNSCYSHMAYYTALSRSATADGTIIIQGFDSKVITRGCSGYLRQEFREHEILDDITRLRYEGHLPDHVNGCV